MSERRRYKRALFVAPATVENEHGASMQARISDISRSGLKMVELKDSEIFRLHERFHITTWLPNDPSTHIRFECVCIHHKGNHWGLEIVSMEAEAKKTFFSFLQDLMLNERMINRGAIELLDS